MLRSPIVVSFVAANTFGASACCASARDPVVLVSYGSSLFRVNADRSGGVEEFAEMPGPIVGMTCVPAGAAVIGCAPGDVIAIEGVDQPRVWRVDGARTGEPLTLVELGSMTFASHASIAFHGDELYIIRGNGTFRRIDPQTFAQIGDAVDLFAASADAVGGLSMGPSGDWYILANQQNALYRYPHPPTRDAQVMVGALGPGFDTHGLEWCDGRLWAGIHRNNNALEVGTIDSVTGAFTSAWSVVSRGGSRTVGMTAFCPTDFNFDNAVNSQDLFDFLGAFFAEAAEADVNRDGGVNSQDFFDFLGGFFAGC